MNILPQLIVIRIHTHTTMLTFFSLPPKMCALRMRSKRVCNFFSILIHTSLPIQHCYISSMKLLTRLYHMHHALLVFLLDYTSLNKLCTQSPPLSSHPHLASSHITTSTTLLALNERLHKIYLLIISPCQQPRLVG